MDWFICQENQNTLWTMINRIPIVLSIPVIIRERLFKETIEEYYHFMKMRSDIYKIPVSLNIKKQINRETISLFMEKLKSPGPVSFTQNMKTESVNNQHIKIIETKQEKSQREFTERQQIYEQMTAKPDIPSPEVFREKEDEDGVIQNMDELIKKYQMEREKDMQFLTPPLTPLDPVLSENTLRTKVSFSSTPDIIPSISVPYKSITILEENAILPINELTHFEDLILPDIPDKKIIKKTSILMKECLDILKQINVDQESVNLYSIFIEKMNNINNSIEEFLREKT